MKKRIGLTIIILFLSLFIYCDKVNAAHMWTNCYDYNKGSDKFKVYNTFAVANDYWGNPRMVAFIDKNDIWTLLKYTNVWGSTRSVGPTLVEAANKYKEQKTCWLKDDSDPKKTCGNSSDLNDIAKMVIDGKCPTTVRNQVGSTTLTSTFLILYGEKAPVSSMQLTESNFIIYKFKTKGQTYIMAEGYDAATGRYSYFRDNGTEMFFEQDVKANNDLQLAIINKTFGVIYQYFSKEGVDKVNNNAFSWLPFVDKKEMTHHDYVYYYDDEYLGWEGATQIVRMGNCTAKYKRQDYYNLSPDNYCSLMSSLAGDGSKKDAEFVFLYDSNDTNNTLSAFTKKWYDANKKNVDLITSKYLALDGKEGKLRETAEGIDLALTTGKKYNLSGDYSVPQFISDLEQAYTDIIGMENETIEFNTWGVHCNGNATEKDVSTAFVRQFYCDTFGKELDQMGRGVNYIDKTTNNGINVAATIELELQEQLKSLSIDVSKGNNIELFKLDEMLRDYVVMYNIAAKYIYSNRHSYDITQVDLDRLIKIMDLFSELAASDKFKVPEIVVDCESLIGPKLLRRINKILDIIKIVIPCFVIGIGIIDFLKGMFSSDEEGMKKAQKDFLTRLVISILIFLAPYLINLLLNIANEVWFFINPNSCGINTF